MNKVPSAESIARAALTYYGYATTIDRVAAATKAVNALRQARSTGEINDAYSVKTPQEVVSNAMNDSALPKAVVARLIANA